MNYLHRQVFNMTLLIVVALQSRKFTRKFVLFRTHKPHWVIVIGKKIIGAPNSSFHVLLLIFAFGSKIVEIFRKKKNTAKCQRILLNGIQEVENLSNVNRSQPQSTKATSNWYRSDRRMHAYHFHDGRSDLCDVRCFDVIRVKRSTFWEQKVGFLLPTWSNNLLMISNLMHMIRIENYKKHESFDEIYFQMWHIDIFAISSRWYTRPSRRAELVIWDCWYFICLLDESVASVFDIRFAVEEISMKCKSRHSNVGRNENELDLRLKVNLKIPVNSKFNLNRKLLALFGHIQTNSLSSFINIQ